MTRSSAPHGARLRIIQVSPSYVPAVRYGGSVLATHALARSLAALGHEVEVFTTNADGDDVIDVEPGVAHDVDGVSVRYHRIDGPRRLYWSRSLARGLADAVASADVVHAHALFLQPVAAAARAARARGVPFVVSPRGMLVRELWSRRSRLAKALWLRTSGRRLLEGASAVHVTSALEREEVERFGLLLDRVTVVPNGIAAPPPPDVERRTDTILFLGRLSWKKGLELLVDCLTRLPDARLRIVGPDDEGLAARIHARATALRIDDRITIAPAANLDARWSEYRAASVFVLPSVSENFANTVLEAMAMACPVVVTPGVGLADAVAASGAGRVCERTPAALASAIGALLGDSRTATEMGARGAELVARDYAWPGIAHRMAALYCGLRAPGEARRAG